MSNCVVAQTLSAPTVVDDGEPYGGVSLFALTTNPGSPMARPGAGRNDSPDGNTGGVCNKVLGVTQPCVLTGQYSRYRTSVNQYETALGGITSGSSSNFGLTNFFPFPTPGAGHPLPLQPNGSSYNFEPVPAQPLYITNLTDSGGTNHAGVLVVGSLDDYIYAFDTTTGAQVWSPIYLATQDCTSSGWPFDNNFGHNPGGTNLPYYGVVATPVIDVYPGIATVPTLFVVSACVTSQSSNHIQWNLDAINLQTGGSLLGHTVIQATGFNPSFQLARASLLLTHPTPTTTNIYVAFGTGAGEVAAAGPNGCPSGFSSCNYSGWMLLYSATYTSTPSVTFSQTASFSTSGTGRATSNVYPSVYASFDTACPPFGPSGVGQLTGAVYDRGDNWAVSQGGIWMSADGPSSGSTTANNVYVTSGNGPFGCTSTNSSQSCPTSSGTAQQCTDPNAVVYWGESAMKFPSGSLAPNDFYAPYKQRFTDHSNGDANAAANQTGELSRLDLDFGSTAPVIVPFANATAPMFALMGDKSGYMYVVPAEPNGTTAAAYLGEFRTDDGGLTNGPVSTQVPFQASQLPQFPNTGNAICPFATSGSPWENTGTSCDEIHEIAFLNNFAVIWPSNESVEVFQGHLTQPGGTGTYKYQLTTVPVFNPCPYDQLPSTCTQGAPNYPTFPWGGSTGVQGAAMAIANAPGTGNATLWAIAADTITGGTWGWLYAYNMNVSTGVLTPWWNSTGTGIANCSDTSQKGWFATSFTEPTLANGAAYVPSACVVTGTISPSVQNCLQVPAANVASGVLVFSSCS